MYKRQVPLVTTIRSNLLGVMQRHTGMTKVLVDVVGDTSPSAGPSVILGLMTTGVRVLITELEQKLVTEVAVG